MEGPRGFPILPLRETIDTCLLLARRVNPKARFVGVSLNTSRISGDERIRLYDKYAAETGLPVADPIRDGVAAIVDRLEQEFGE